MQMVYSAGIQETSEILIYLFVSQEECNMLKETAQ